MDQINELDIAIIGLSGRFPQAKDINSFWQNLKDGVECISTFSEQELLDSGIRPELLKNPNYVRARAVLSDIEMFDAAFFGLSAKEAKQLDPQQRLFLESAWEVIESAGYDPEKYAGSIGVYAGVGLNTYLLNNIPVNIDFQDVVGQYQLLINSDKDFLSTRVSYKLNLTGPSVNVQTACSTTLVAVHLACQSLLNGECDMALAGGVSILLPQKIGHLYTEGMIYSRDGHCRAFDAKAKGTVVGSGLGIVLLKRLENAIADRDYIHAIIKGSAINNDGSLKVGYTAPSTEGQAKVIDQAQAVAEVDAESITYIEAHGTGTTLGDPIEIAALTKAFRQSTQKKNFCAIGSLKTNMGHLDTAAGVAGLIKTVLALKHKLIPPSLHFDEPSPNIDFANSPFYVNTTLSEWNSNGTPRRAGVSSFGIGGTNAHVILEEAPLLPPSGKSRPRHLLLISAKTSSALEQVTANLGTHLQENPELNLADLAYTLSCGRKAFEHRRMLVCQEIKEAVVALTNLDSQQVFTNTLESTDRPVVFMFPGQGSQYVNMALELYETEPLFRQQVDLCSEILKQELELDLRQILYPQPEQTQIAKQQLEQTAIAQSAIFVVEYALAKLWQSWGVYPQAMIGHSIGEYVAATLAEVFSLETALSLVAARGKMIQKLPKGAMLSTPLPAEQVQPLLTEELSIAAINEAFRCVISGSTEAIDILENKLASQSIECRRLHTSHAFHSQMMEPILDEFRQRVGQESLKSPQIPFISSLTGDWIKESQATDPNHWVQHLRQTVLFAKGIEKLLQNPEQILLEVGPGRTLGSLSKRHLAHHEQKLVLASVRHPQEELSDVAFLLNSLGHLWLAGIEVDWSRFYIQEERDRVPLPTYPFQRQRYWIETTEKETRKSSKPQKSSTKIVELLNKADTSTLAQKLEQSANFTAQQQKLLPEILEILVKQHRQELNVATIEDWLYQFQWKPIKHNPTKTKIQPSKWIFFADRTGVAEKIAHQLQLLGCECILVYRGDHYQKLKIDTYQLNPTDSVEFEQLIVEIQSKSELPLQKVIHLWSLDTPATEDLTLSSLESAQLWGCGTVLHIVQALIKTNNLPQLWLVTRATQSVCSKTEKVSVAASPLWGMGRVLSLEYPQMRGVLVDLDPRTPESETETLLKLITDKELEEDHLAVREAQTYVARLVKQSLQPSPSVSLESDAIYLITGGLGALGLHTAKWMVEKGAQNLILIGRTQPSQEKQALINDLQQKGASVVVVQADVSNAEDFSKVFQQIDSSMLPLKGVVHAAGVAGFKPMLQMELIQLEEVMAPKVKGGWILHQLTKDKELDFFVSFSSFSAVCGGVGDAHYGASNQFLDALTHYRQAKGLPSFSINWGPWSGGGMASKQNLNLMIKIGIEPLTPEQGITALEQLWTSDHPQTIVANVNWGLFKQLQLYEIGRQRLLLEEIEVELLEIQSSTIEPKIKILEEIEAASENELQDILLAYVQLEMSKLLGLNSSQLLEVDLSLVEMGMDSLMAIELKNRLQTHLGISFPITLAFEYPTIRKLSEYLYQEVMRRESIENNDSNLPKFDKREIVKDRQNYQTDVEKTERRRGAL